MDEHAKGLDDDSKLRENQNTAETKTARPATAHETDNSIDQGKAESIDKSSKDSSIQLCDGGKEHTESEDASPEEKQPRKDENKISSLPGKN